MNYILLATASASSTLLLASSDTMPRYYAGKYGDAIVSTDINQAIKYSAEDAKQKVRALNRVARTNGWTFSIE
jgi:hypothetical protein